MKRVWSWAVLLALTGMGLFYSRLREPTQPHWTPLATPSARISSPQLPHFSPDWQPEELEALFRMSLQ